MSPYWYALRIIQAFEDRIIALILKQPGFHRAVGRIHRTIDEAQYGRNPNEPLAPGEASADPNAPKRGPGFINHFLSELRNQASGKPTDLNKSFETVHTTATEQISKRGGTKSKSNEDFKRDLAKKYPSLFEDSNKPK